MANYLPLLLVSVTTSGSTDDCSLTTPARGQVDYLSHVWQEEDVWRSWRSMTRQKNEIANGMRLENASWRTWWKQRNKLRTISPETLNWLKDSDVTWLYGPLHTAIDYSPPPRPKADPDTVDKEKSAHDRLDLQSGSSRRPTVPDSPRLLPNGKKTILKHRSISELLQSPLPSTPPLEDIFDEDEDDRAHPQLAGFPARPPIAHTKSDSSILRWRRGGQAFRKDSPPRVVLPVDDVSTPASEAHIADNHPQPSRANSSDNSSNGASQNRPKKHISFNTFVEQCIAIDNPADKTRTTSLNGRGARLYDPRFDEDSDDDIPEEEISEGSMSESEDEALEMRPRSRSSSSSRPALPQAYISQLRPPLQRTFSNEKEHVTIAPIAPTLLKSTLEDEPLATHVPGMCSPVPGELVYVPRVGSNYSLLSPSRSGSSEDVHYHREAHFSIGTGYRLPPTASTSDLPALHYPLPSRSSASDSRTFFPTVPVSASPEPGAGLDTYDYFGSAPDMGEEYAGHLPHGRRSSLVDDDDDGGVGDDSGDVMVEHSDTSSKTSSGLRTPSPEDGVAQATVRIAHSAPVPVPAHSSTTAAGSASPPASAPPPPVIVTRSSANNSRLLSPPDAGSLRVRTTSSPTASPGLGSAPERGRGAGSSSRRGSVETRDEPRGRSNTRTSSFSDRERSSSRGGNSPLGSISPSGSLIGVAAGAYVGGREQRGRSSRCSSRGNSSESLNSLNGERGRNRTSRRLSESLSPPSLVGAASSSPVMQKHAREETGSSSRTIKSALPTPIPEEDEQLPPTPVAPVRKESLTKVAPASSGPKAESSPRARATPTSSPATSSPGSGTTISQSIIASMKRPGMPVAPPSPSEPTTIRDVSPPSSIRTSQSPPPTAMRAESKRRKLSGDLNGEGSLVGRAADVVSAARGFFGHLWHTNA